MKMTKEELDQILADHKAWLEDSDTGKESVLRSYKQEVRS